MLGLVKYDAACKALAEAKAVDEVKEIRNVAEAMRIYAKQAKNRQLEVQAGEIRIRAERRVGQLIQAQKESVGLNQGAVKGKTGSKANPVLDSRPTLAEAGIDKKLANRARTLARVPDGEFEAEVSGWRKRVSKETERVTTNLMTRGEQLERAEEEVGPEGAFLLRAEAAADLAFYAGPITKDVIRLARRAEAAWHTLIETLMNHVKEIA